jgi:hypothetical protein
MSTYTDESEYTPARVHIVADDTKPEPAQRKFVNVTHKTYLPGTTPELILPRSAGRRCATITVMGVLPTNSNVVLADNNADAQAAVTYATPGTMAGAVLQPGMFIRLTHNDEVWLVKFGAGTAAVVGVISEYEA